MQRAACFIQGSIHVNAVSAGNMRNVHDRRARLCIYTCITELMNEKIVILVDRAVLVYTWLYISLHLSYS